MDNHETWTPIYPSVEMPSIVVRFHKVLGHNGDVIDTLAVLEDGRTISMNTLFGDPEVGMV